MRISRRFFSGCCLLIAIASRHVANSQGEHEIQWQIPEETLQPFGSYPNILNISTAKEFHPIVKFPKGCWKNETFVCPYSDYSKLQPYTKSQLLPRENFERKLRRIPLIARLRRFWHSRILLHDKSKRYIGRYDEDRVNLYDTELFLQSNESNKRTVHVGIDLAGYVGTPVYSFDTGIVQTLGYNPAHGDYGNVVIVKYAENFYVLYGHLDAASCRRHQVGDIIRKGDIIGWMGDAYENGGWTTPHVHVQISTLRPRTHDLPGAVRRQDRMQALQIYPDPRYITGELY